MKSYLKKHTARRWGYDGWAMSIDGHVLDWTVCTTREECRQLRREVADLFERRAEIVKVKVSARAA